VTEPLLCDMRLCQTFKACNVSFDKGELLGNDGTLTHSQVTNESDVACFLISNLLLGIPSGRSLLDRHENSIGC